MKWFRQLAINQKFLTCLVLLIILPILLSFYFVYQNYARNNQDKFDESLYLSLMEKSGSLQYLLADMDDYCLKAMSSANMRALEKHYATGNRLAYERLRYGLWVNMSDALSRRAFVGQLCVSTDSDILFQMGRATLRFEALPPKHLELSSWTPRFALTQLSADQLFRRVDSVAPLISVLRVAKGSLPGSEVLFRYSADESAVFAQINSAAYADALCLLTDERGRVVSAKDKSLIGLPLDQVTDMAIPQAGHSRVFGSSGDHLALRYPIAIAGWDLLYYIPLSELYTGDSLAPLLTLLAVLFCVVFGVLFYLALRNTVIRPIIQLTRNMVTLGDGQPERPQPGDEVQALTRSFDAMKKRINELIEKVYIAQLHEKDAQLQALTSQINPHFLYNTLDSIRFCALLSKNHQVARQIEMLSNLFRHSLGAGGSVTTIREEMRHLQSYISLQALRFDERIAFSLECPDALLECECPRLLLQPLVENAILHGLEQKTDQGHMWIRVLENDDGDIVLSVQDDGLGADSAEVHRELSENANPQKMLALKNIQARLRIRYGAGYGIRFESEAGRGAQVSVTIPKRKAGG